MQHHVRERPQHPTSTKQKETTASSSNLFAALYDELKSNLQRMRMRAAKLNVLMISLAAGSAVAKDTRVAARVRILRSKSWASSAAIDTD
jgi:hypothetical protein